MRCDRAAYEESEARLATVGHKDAVLAHNEQRVGLDDFARPLSDCGKHLVRRAVRTQDDHFAVPVSYDRASIRKEPPGVDKLEDVVARTAAVAVAGLRGQAERCDGGRHTLVRDDPHARAVRDLDGHIARRHGIGIA